MNRTEKRQAREQKIVDEFNARFPVGTRVMLKRDRCQVPAEVLTTVRSPGEVLSGHTAVAWFEGISGCYAIEGRVREAVPANIRAELARLDMFRQSLQAHGLLS